MVCFGHRGWGGLIGEYASDVQGVEPFAFFGSFQVQTRQHPGVIGVATANAGAVDSVFNDFARLAGGFSGVNIDGRQVLVFKVGTDTTATVRPATVERFDDVFHIFSGLWGLRDAKNFVQGVIALLLGDGGLYQVAFQQGVMLCREQGKVPFDPFRGGVNELLEFWCAFHILLVG